MSQTPPPGTRLLSLASSGAPFTLHDLRRTCRTGLSRVGVRPDIAERVLNHSPGRLVATYDVHEHLEERRAALERWAAHVQSLGQSS